MRKLGDEDPFSRSVSGSLLVAHPNMLDPNFRRTVLFVSEHDPNEGALGVIINRPLDKQVADLVSETPPADLAQVPVFLGGPVGKNQRMFAAFEWQKAKDSNAITTSFLNRRAKQPGRRTWLQFVRL